MSARLNPFAAAPEVITAMVAFETAVVSSGLEHSLVELVKMRASQINGCAYCLHMHSLDARQAGESEDRLHLLAAWWESSLFTPREKAALTWTDSLTLIAQTRAPDADVRLEIHEDGSMLVAENMPAPPSGRIYQVWLKRPGKDPEPTSVLWSTRGDGSAEVAVPGSLEGVEAVLVTDEPPGGSEEPTKPPVITAETA